MSTITSDARLTYGRAVRSEILKLTTMRSMWWVAVAAIAVSLVTVATGTHTPPAPGTELEWTLMTVAATIVAAWVIVSVYAALQATGEWSSGMYRVSFAAVPRRTLWLAAKATVLGLFAAAVSVVVLVAATAVVLARYSADGATVDLTQLRTWETYLGVPLVCLLTAVMAVGIGALVRSSGIAVTVVVGLLVVLPFAALFGLDWLAQVTSYLPSGAGDAIVRSGAFGLATDDLGVVLGTVVMLAWAAGACLLASFAMSRRDA